jgi:hypothetical protein
MMAASCRLAVGNLEMWENDVHRVPWAELERLGRCSDAEAANWLVATSRTQDMVGVFMGYQELLKAAENRPDDARCQDFLTMATQARTLGAGMRLFASYWFELPMACWTPGSRVHAMAV